MQSGLAQWLHSPTVHSAPHRCRSRCVQPLTAAAVATLPNGLADSPRNGSRSSPNQQGTASQLLQNIASSSDWRYLQGLYEQHAHIMTTAHVAAIAMQLPRAVQPGGGTPQPDTPAQGPIDPGLHGLYDEIMPRLEGQLHVMPARLLLGIASALDVCNMPCTPSWRAAYLSAVAVLLSPPKPDDIVMLSPPPGQHSAATGPSLTARTPAQAAAASFSPPSEQTATPDSALAGSQSCSPIEALSLARHVFVMYSGPGCTEEALSSAALTERLLAVTTAAATAAAALRPQASGGDSSVQSRLAAASEAAACLLSGTGALTRPDAFPARIIIQLLEALRGLQVEPPQRWLSACHQGLQVTARPGQMETALSLLTHLGWKQTPEPTRAATPTLPPSTATPQRQKETLQTPTAAAGTAAGRPRTAGGRRKTKQPSTAAASAAAAAAPVSPATTVPPSLLTSAPNSALEGMISLLRDAAASKMLPELKATVFSQLEVRVSDVCVRVCVPACACVCVGLRALLRYLHVPVCVCVCVCEQGCDPGLVLWTAEAFHQLGTPLTGRELAQCVHLAVSAVGTAQDR